MLVGEAIFKPCSVEHEQEAFSLVKQRLQDVKKEINPIDIILSYLPAKKGSKGLLWSHCKEMLNLAWYGYENKGGTNQPPSSPRPTTTPPPQLSTQKSKNVSRIYETKEDLVGCPVCDGTRSVHSHNSICWECREFPGKVTRTRALEIKLNSYANKFR